MRVARQATVAGFLLILLPTPVLPSAWAEVFLSPGLEARGGYTSNRFLEPGSEGSAFTFVAPSLELTWFGPRTTELSLSIRHQRTDYLRSGFSSVRETVGQGSLSRFFGLYAAALDIEVGTYDDGALPLDDSDWFRFVPSVSRDLTEQLTGSLAASVTGTRYENRETSGGDRQTEVHWRASPGLTWAASAAWSVWGTASLDLNRSNEDSEDYWGGGVTLGADYWSHGSTRIGGWVSGRVLEYNEEDPVEEQDRRDTPLGAGGWVAFRVAPWAELTAETRYLRYYSTEDASDYTLWSVDAGLRVVYDWDASALMPRP